LDVLAKTQLLIIDDWLRNPLSEVHTQDLLEIIDDRYKRTSTALASQVPVANWHERFSSPTLSDAIMDRLVHNVYRLELKGESMRKRRSPC
jgi:DNA replication protein DnaC